MDTLISKIVNLEGKEEYPNHEVWFDLPAVNINTLVTVEGLIPDYVVTGKIIEVEHWINLDEKTVIQFLVIQEDEREV